MCWPLRHPTPPRTERMAKAVAAFGFPSGGSDVSAAAAMLSPRLTPSLTTPTQPQMVFVSLLEDENGSQCSTPQQRIWMIDITTKETLSIIIGIEEGADIEEAKPEQALDDVFEAEPFPETVTESTT